MSVYSPREIDNLIIGFKNHPIKETYDTVMEWYNHNFQLPDYPDPEHIVCVYIFLLKVNLKHMFIPMSKDDVNEHIAQLRDLIQEAEPFYRGRRKSYMDAA